MAQLEQRLGMRLCERGIKGFKLTSEGEVVLDAADRLFSAMEDFKLEVSEAKDKLVGELRLGLVDNLITHPDCRVVEALTEFSDLSDDLTCSIFVGAPHQLEGRLLDGRLHAVVSYFTRELDQVDYIDLFPEQQKLYCGKRHPFFARPDDEITDQEVSQAKAVHKDDWGETGFANDDNMASTSRYVEGMATLVLSGRYIGYLPMHYAAFWEMKGEMRAIRPDSLDWSVQICAAVKRQTSTPVILEKFLKLLVEKHSHPQTNPVAARQAAL